MEDSSHVSSIKGTIGYVDPEYYNAQHFTEKSDVYSFGIVLLELISGRNPIFNENSGGDCSYILEWAKEHIESGNIHAIIDPEMEKTNNIQSVWKIAEIALMCVQLRKVGRPSISEVLKEIQEAIIIEQNASISQIDSSIDINSRNSVGSNSTIEFNMYNSVTSDLMKAGLR